MDIGKLRSPGTSVHTEALGAVVVHPITLGGMMRLAGRYPGDGANYDAGDVANAILGEVCRAQRADGTSYGERELTTDELAALTPADRSAIVRLVCEAQGWDPSGPPSESLVRGFRAEVNGIQERGRVLSDELKKPTAGAESVLSAETMAKLAQSSAQVEAIKASLQLPDWLDQMKARQRLHDLQPLGSGSAVSPARPDLRRREADRADAPWAQLVAAAERHGDKLDGIAEAQRLTLQSQTDMNSTVLAAAQELSVRARASERQARTGYWIAIAAIAAAALVSLLQVYQSMRYKEDYERRQDRVERLLGEQRDQLKALRDQNEAMRQQSERDSAALRDQLRKTVPSAEAPVTAAVPKAKSTKQAASAKPVKRAAAR